MTTTADVLPTDEDNEESRPVNDQEAAESESNQLSAASSSELPSPATKHEERLKRLGELRMRLNEARKRNHAEYVEEDRRSKIPANFETRRRRAEWELAEQKARKEAEDRGENYERLKVLDTGADELERLDRKRKKKNPDQGFSGFAAAQFRQYQRLTRQMKSDMDQYEAQKERLGDSFYPSVDTLLDPQLTKPSPAGVERMVQDLEKQIEKRGKYSRRRQFFDEADIDYINERNMKFNQKAARYYDKYTAEIKQNLERGTAV
ncbi:pre-mRNA-splicing factor syf2-like [Corticium candelabrum]|uniref:pre-mRNA-splicing factor syf2-like n=1 Tax=Corticium candelabrum TaxID=121492 RepID=UPI002E26F4A0|nr:pre-mRNA-splicing factor syf2-like [Corticium candelabrum]